MATSPAMSSPDAPAIMWFRRDLRLADNPALHAAVASGRPLILVYVRENDPALRLSPGRAADWWLHKSLESLAGQIAGIGGSLTLIGGCALTDIPALADRTGAAEVYWNRVDWPWIDARDCEIAGSLKAAGVRPRAFRTTTLIDPAGLMTGSGTPYKVFTAFWRAALETLSPRTPLPAPNQLRAATAPHSDALGDWKLLPTAPDWAYGFSDRWTPGETAASRALERFTSQAIGAYPDARDRPDLFGTSRLSPHLGWGEISPRTVWYRVHLQAERGGMRKPVEKYLSEIGWRDFAYYLVHHFGDLRATNFNRQYDHFPWRKDPVRLRAWRAGRTGVPTVDAAMRELWHTGWMHNRTRMIAASYLIKHIGVHWQAGMRWFEDTLVDADPVVNSASWQWVAGSGADAAPYFRIFNPASQGAKFDPEGAYVRRWVPELCALPTRYIHAPWTAKESELARLGVKLGETYPRPVVGLADGRTSALEAYRHMKSESETDTG